MASRGLGTLTLDLIAKIGGFTGPLNKAERELDARTKRMNKMAYDFGRSFGGAIRSAAGSFLAFAGVTVSIGGAVSAIKSAIDSADQLRDASVRLGVGTEILSKWGYAARQTGADLEGLTKGLRILSRNATEALDGRSQQAGLFKALGIDQESLRDLESLVPKIADAFRGMEDGPQKAALAMELFGKSGADLVEFLNSGSAGLDEFGDKLERLGGVVTPQTAAAADEFNDKLADLIQQFTGASLALAERLLPHLVDFIDWAGEAKDESSGLGKIVAWLGDQVDATAKDFEFFSQTADELAGYADHLGRRWQALVNLFKASDQILMGNFAGAKALYQQGDALLSANFSNVSGGAKTSYDNRFKPAYERASLNFNPNPGGKSNPALDAYFGGGSRSSGGSRGGGKSKAQQEADQLQASFDRLNETLEQQIALNGKTGETAKERYEIESGELAKLSPALKQVLLTKLDTIDALNAEDEAYKKSLETAKEREDAINSAIKNADDMIKDMEFELQLLGLTNKEREREIALRYAGADATEEQRKKIGELSDQLYQNREVAGFWENAQRSLSDALYDTAMNAGNALEIAKNFFDSIAQYITRMIADQWSEKLTSLFKSKTGDGAGSSGSGGGLAGFFGSLLGGLFGGGKADGGWTMPNKLYRVNERGFELATVGGNDYMLTGSKPVHITPNHRVGSGGGFTQVNNFTVQGKIDPRSENQIVGDVGRKSQTAMRRRGG